MNCPAIIWRLLAVFASDSATTGRYVWLTCHYYLHNNLKCFECDGNIANIDSITEAVSDMAYFVNTDPSVCPLLCYA